MEGIQYVVENYKKAINPNGKSVVTMVTSQTGEKESVAIVQSNLLPELRDKIILSENCAKELLKIYEKYVKNNLELPFIMTGLWMKEANAFIISRVHYFKNKQKPEELMQREAYFNEAEMVEFSEVAKEDALKYGLKPFFVVCHTHPEKVLIDNVEVEREYKTQIANNFSAQDLSVTEQISNNIKLVGKYNGVEYKGFDGGIFATMMLNGLGDLNFVINNNGRFYKIPGIYYQDSENKHRPISDMNNGKDNLGVYRDPSMYDIPLTPEIKLDLYIKNNNEYQPT